MSLTNHSLASTAWPSNLLYTCNMVVAPGVYIIAPVWCVTLQKSPGEVRKHVSITTWLIGFCKENKILLPLDPFPERQRGLCFNIVWFQETVCDSWRWLSKSSALINCDTYCFCMVIWLEMEAQANEQGSKLLLLLSSGEPKQRARNVLHSSGSRELFML